MIFQHIDFHNADEIVPFEDGYRLWRLPQAVRDQVNDGLRDRVAGFNTGVELRFRMKGDGVTLLLRSLPDQEAQVAYIYYGSLQGGWERSARIIGTDVTRVRIDAIDNADELRAISQAHHLPFSSDVVRVLLPYGTCVYLGCEGDVEPPRPEDLPTKTYLAYGSSITHGGLALGTPHTYAFRIAKTLGMDYLNKGFAGCAHAEKAMADYIASRKDWDVCSVELGANMLPDYAPYEFERRIDAFTAVLAEDPRPVFATSIFGFNGGDQVRGQLFRDIVRKYAEKRLIFIDGLELLNDPAFISQDMVHPTLDGQEQIARRWGEFMRSKLGFAE